jgi:YVTN family beta-propeller protein
MRKNLLSASLFILLWLAVQPIHAATSRNSAASEDTPAVSAIVVENWTKPEKGWLYVLDPAPDQNSGGRIWLLDPESGKTMGSIRTGESADFALSPDGARLYVASVTDGDASELAVIDTVAGKVLTSGVVNSRALARGMLPYSTMAVSGDGAVLRILIETPNPDAPESFMLASFDTQTNEFLPGVVHLGNCGPGRFIDMPAADQFDVLCPRTNRIRLIRVDADSRTLQNIDIVLPWERRVGAAEVIEVPGSEKMGIVRGDGAVAEMSLPAQEFTETDAHPELPNRVPPAAWPTSPEGDKIFLGYNRSYEKSYDNRFYLDYGRPPNVRPGNSTVDEFRVLDTHTWRRIATIKTKMPCWSAAISNDGKLLYATSPQKHSVLVIDTATRHVIRTLKIPGTPALALVSP